jgi:hypothetical protein
MSMPISHPWSARRSSAGAPKEGGQRVREQLSPSWLRAQTTDGCPARTARASVLLRRSLSLKELRSWNSRGVLCRACVRGDGPSAAKWQPGRERPPLPPSRWGSNPRRGGSLTPRLRVLSVRTHGPSHSSSEGHSAGSAKGLASRRAQRRETVTTAALSFLNGRTPCH